MLDNVKTIDSIYFKFGVEFKQFNTAVRHYMETSSDFEGRLIAKEAEIFE